MKRLRQTATTLLACYFMLIAARVTAADSYSLDMSHTSIVFGISHFNYSYTYGRFNKAQGSFRWDNANPAAGQFVLAIDAASIDTNDPKRDDHLRNADFFNANQFPQIVFQSTAIKPTGSNNFDVLGNLTMHGVTKQVTLPVRKLGEGQGPYGKHRCGFFCQTTLNRSDFGMSNMIPNIGNQVAITISFEGIRQAGTGSGSASAGSGSAAKPAGSGSAP
ncbi:MAG: YceI family protein [Bythopirellula sp.]